MPRGSCVLVSRLPYLAAIVMLASIGMITVITAAVTSTFVAAAARREAHTENVATNEVHVGLDQLSQRLERIEAALGLPSDPSPGDTDDG